MPHNNAVMAVTSLVDILINVCFLHKFSGNKPNRKIIIRDFLRMFGDENQ